MKTLTDLETNLLNSINKHFGKLCNNTNYVNRLGTENNWDFNYTIRVIEEYKKFLFIFANDHKPVSPSHPIDEAWHTHILYTKDYFDDLTKILGTMLHHEPETGKNDQTEINQLKDWYTNTLDRYHNYFEDEPKDIWTIEKSKNYSIPNYDILKSHKPNQSFFEKLFGSKKESLITDDHENNRYSKSLRNIQSCSSSSYSNNGMNSDILMTYIMLDSISNHTDSGHKCSSCISDSHNTTDNSFSSDSTSHSSCSSSHSNCSSTPSCSSGSSCSSSSSCGGSSCGGS